MVSVLVLGSIGRGFNRSWVRILVHINEEPPFLAPIEDILGKYTCGINVALEIEMTYFGVEYNYLPVYCWILRRV